MNSIKKANLPPPSLRPTVRFGSRPSSLVKVADPVRRARKPELRSLQAGVRGFYGPGDQLLKGLGSPEMFRLFFTSLFAKVFDDAGLTLTGKSFFHQNRFVRQIAYLAGKNKQLIYVPSRSAPDIFVSGNTGLDRTTIYSCDPGEMEIKPELMPGVIDLELIGLKGFSVGCLVAVPITALVRRENISQLGTCHGVFIAAHSKLDAFHPASHVEVINQIGLDAGALVESKPKELGDLLATLKLLDQRTSATKT